MSNAYDQMPEPKSGGDYPEIMRFTAPGQSVEGVITDVRWKEANATSDGCIVISIKQADGVEWSVFCGPTSLQRQIHTLKPPPGSMIRVLFKGFEGQAKIFQVDVAPGNGQAPAQAPAPATAPAPAAPGFAPNPAMPMQQGEQPFGRPAAAPQQAPAAPWGS